MSAQSIIGHRGMIERKKGVNAASSLASAKHTQSYYSTTTTVGQGDHQRKRSQASRDRKAERAHLLDGPTSQSIVGKRL